MTNKKLYNFNMSPYYKGIKVNLYGIPVCLLEENKKTKIKTTNRKRYFYNLSFHNEENNYSAPKDLILIYDIPETKKKERDWFRRQLINLNFIMIQKSVWVGPSPLPKNFLNYLKELNILNDFKTLKLEKPYEKK